MLYCLSLTGCKITKRMANNKKKGFFSSQKIWKKQKCFVPLQEPIMPIIDEYTY
jgi:hypothetical protein